MKHIKSGFYLLLFLASPLLMIGGVLTAIYTYPDIPFYPYVMLVTGFLLKLSNKTLERGFNRNKQEMEYDEYGRRKGLEDYSSMSKKERIQIDKQKLASMEQIVSSTALKQMTKPGSRHPEDDMEKLISMAPVKAQMKKMTARMEYDRINKKKKKIENNEVSRHMIFAGSSGTGKTSVARIMTGFLYKNNFIKENKCLEIDGNFLKATTPADTALKTEIIIRHAFGGVLFIDEAYVLASDEVGKSAVATLIKQMEDNRGKFVLIIAGYTDEMKKLIQSNPGFASRFKDTIEFPDYSSDELAEIFRTMVHNKNLCLSEGALEHFYIRIQKERELPSFGNARTVRNIVEESIDAHALHIKEGSITAGKRYVLLENDVSETPSKNPLG